MYKQRNIRFRAWSQKKAKFLVEGFHIIGETTLFDLLGQYRVEELDDPIITEWTGFVDLKGVKVYEGDIIQSVLVPWGSSLKETIAPIYFSKGAFKAIAPLDSYVKSKDVLNVTVIGNIYENANLIEDWQLKDKDFV